MDRCSLTSPLSCFRPLLPSTDPPRLTFFFSLFFVLFFCSLSFHLFLLPASSWHAHCRFYPTVIYRDFSRSRSIKHFGETIPRSLAAISPKIVFQIFWHRLRSRFNNLFASNRMQNGVSIFVHRRDVLFILEDSVECAIR